MFRNAYQRQLAIVIAICLLAIAAFVFTMGTSSAGEGPGRYRMIGVEIVNAEMIPDCALPTPAPACTAGETICSEGTGTACHAAVYTCGGTPPTWGTGTQCTFNACTGTPGSVGSKCQ